jgi:hypothetical protein
MTRNLKSRAGILWWIQLDGWLLYMLSITPHSWYFLFLKNSKHFNSADISERIDTLQCECVCKLSDVLVALK